MYLTSVIIIVDIVTMTLIIGAVSSIGLLLSFVLFDCYS